MTVCHSVHITLALNLGLDDVPLAPLWLVE